ncbi:CD209 antigen-like protein D [Oratosquilla oratoria]|uniref:CD209 antigen-like protein D n=1 Tax=Oratosquilla oratoria TaxID=337810 RepID=UPI003F776839
MAPWHLVVALLALPCLINAKSCRPPFIRVGNDCIYVNRDTKKNWEQSRTLCKAYGGDLAVPSNLQTLATFLKETSDWNALFWLGASDIDKEGDWRWVDGSMNRPDWWVEGEPTGLTEREDCINMELEYSTLLHDTDCDILIHCVCQEIQYL